MCVVVLAFPRRGIALMGKTNLGYERDWTGNTQQL